MTGQLQIVTIIIHTPLDDIGELAPGVITRSRKEVAQAAADDVATRIMECIPKDHRCSLITAQK